MGEEWVLVGVTGEAGTGWGWRTRLSKQSRLGKEFFMDMSSMTKAGKGLF